MAQESQDKHELLIVDSRAVDALKIKEEEAYKEFFKLKQEFNKFNDELKANLKIYNKATGRRKSVKKVKRQKKQVADKKVIENQRKEAESKIMKGGKLTTEDLLAFQ